MAAVSSCRGWPSAMPRGIYLRPQPLKNNFGAKAMEFFKIRHDIPFMRHALVFNIISVVTFVLAVFYLIFRGLNLGVDFTGGTVMEVHYAQSADLSKVRAAIDELDFHDVSVQNFGTSQNVLVRIPAKVTVPEGSERSLTE